jgi:periplasmic divalent cation tolerance protein
VSERLLVLTTVTRAEDAEKIAEALVEKRLAACVNVLPGVRSIYRWKGAVERDEERLLVVKTRADRFDALREAILAAHPYEMPEVVAVPIEAGSPAYLRWLDESVGEE